MTSFLGVMKSSDSQKRRLEGKETLLITTHTNIVMIEYALLPFVQFKLRG